MLSFYCSAQTRLQNDYIIVAQLNLWYFGTGCYGGFEDYDCEGNSVVSIEPLLGRYFSSDANIIRQQIDWAAEYGVDAFSIEWISPRGAPGSLEENMDDHFLSAPNLWKIKWCIFYDFNLRLGWDGYNIALGIDFDNPYIASTFIGDFIHFADKYFTEPSYLRIDGRPVVYIWSTWNFYGDLQSAVSAARDSLSDRGYDVFIAGDEITTNGFDPNHAALFDANTTFTMLIPGTPPLANMDSAAGAVDTIFNAWQDSIDGLTVTGRIDPVLLQPAWAPQYKDSLFRIHNDMGNPIYVPAESKDQVIHMAEVARGFADPLGTQAQKIVWLNTYNNWAETTTIEPTVASGPKYPAGNYHFDMLEVVEEVFGSGTILPGAVHFAGAGDYMQVAHSAVLAPEEFTIELWLRIHDIGDPDLAGGEQTIIDKRGPGTGYNLRLAGTQFPLPVFMFASETGVSISDVVYPHIWYHIAVTQDSDSLKIYFNGELAGAEASAYQANTTSPLRIGEFLGYPAAYLGLRGDIDELRIWNVARSGNQIKTSMHDKLSGHEANLAGYWDFDSYANDTVYDLSPNGNNGILYGNAELIESDAPVGFIPPSAPIGLRAHGGERQIDLVWEASSEDIVMYQIYRGDSVIFSADQMTLLSAVPGTQTSFSDVTVTSGQDYYYKVRSRNQSEQVSAPGRPAFSRTLPFNDGYLTGVYYYPWYGPGIGGHDWEGQYVRDFLIPQQPPLLGHYSCRDSLIIRQHLNWMESYGIDFMVSSWWGQNTWENITLANHILPELPGRSVRFSVYYESPQIGFDNGEFYIDAAKEARLLSDFIYIADNYFSHPNFLKINNRPVVFIYLSRLFAGNYEQAFSHIRGALNTRGYDIFLVGDEVGWGSSSPTHMQFLDAVSPYITFGNPAYEGYALDSDFFADISVQVAEWERVAGGLGKKVIPNVFPGFNNREIPGNQPYAAPRLTKSGAASTSMLEEFIRIMKPFVDPDLKMLMITSWNEWHEDTQIEPVSIAGATSADMSQSGSYYTQGYSYEGDGLKPLEVVRNLLASEIPDNIEKSDPDLPAEFRLDNAYPNPFNSTATISYQLVRPELVDLSVYNIRGQLIERLENKFQNSGRYTVQWNAGNRSSGVYFIKINAGEFSSVKKLLLLK